MNLEHETLQLNTDELIIELKKRLSESRLKHSLRVAESAVLFAKKVGYDEKKAEITALLHDIARELNDEQMRELVSNYKITLSSFNLNYPPTIHGIVGAAIVEKEFGITDEEMLRAIRNHVSGRPCMTTPEKILYLADHIDRLKFFAPEAVSEVKAEPLDEALYHILGYVIEYDTVNRKAIDERTLQTFDWMIETINNNEKSGPSELNESDLERMYERMDELLEMNSDHALVEFPAENLRDLGGYQTADGHTIRRHKIIRSGNLNNFSSADFEKLADYGINYVIDFRTADEKEKKIDTGSRIHYIELPFEAVGSYRDYLEKLEGWINECEDPEESAWLTATYFNSFEIDDVYLKILLDPSTPERLERILKIMLNEDCTGVLIMCNSGKDRTGIITGMILNVLGIPSETVLNDYMLSSISYYALTLNWINKLRKQDYNLKVQGQIVSVLGVEEDRPKRLNEEIRKRFGDYQTYFSSDRLLSEDERKRFREKYLE